MKVKTTFVVLLAVTAVVLSSSVVVGFQLYKEQLHDQKEAEIRTGTEHVRSELDTQLLGLEQTLELWAQNPSVGGDGNVSRRAALAAFRNRTAFSGVSVISANGTMTAIVAGIPPETRQRLVGSDFSDRTYVERALQGQTYTSRPVAAESGNYIVTMSTPIRRDGEIVGTLNAAFHLSDGALFEQFASNLPASQGLTVRSRSGTVLYETAPEPSTDLIRSEAMVRTTGWTVQVTESRRVVESTARTVTYLQVGSLLAVLLSVGTFGWWVYRRNIQHLADLLDGFEALGAREYGTRIAFEGGDEWERIERGFNGASAELARYATERDEREQELRRFRRAVAAAGHAIFITDRDGTIEYVNPAFENVTGYDRETALGRTPAILNSGEMSASFFEELWSTIESGSVWDEEIVNRRADGDLYHAHQTIAPILDDEETIEGFVAIQTDVTERKEREAELRLSRRAIDEAPVGIAISDPDQPDNPLVYVNQGFVQLTGYTRPEALGRNCRFLQGPDTDRESAVAIREAIDEKQPIRVEIRNYRKDGTEFWNRLTIAPVSDDDGEVTHYIGFQEDVTERKEREKHMQVLDRVLRHNIRNEMSVIRGRAESIAAASTGEVAAGAEEIIEKSDELLDTAEKERAITEVLTGQLTEQQIELGPYIETVVGRVTERHPDASIDVDCPEGLVVSAIPNFGDAIEELVTNAVVHSDRETPAVDLRVTVDGATVRIDIEDDGPGIPEMERDVLTRRAGHDALYHGSGLGLWLANWIVSHMDGTLEFTANQPRGSVVSVVIPRTREDSRLTPEFRSRVADE